MRFLFVIFIFWFYYYYYYYFGSVHLELQKRRKSCRDFALVYVAWNAWSAIVYLLLRRLQFNKAESFFFFFLLFFWIRNYSFGRLKTRFSGFMMDGEFYQWRFDTFHCPSLSPSLPTGFFSVNQSIVLAFPILLDRPSQPGVYVWQERRGCF